MNLVTDGKYVGCKMGSSKNGNWYQLSFVSDGDPFTIRCTDQAYNDAQSLDFGSDMQIEVNLRKYQNDWLPRIERIS